MKPLEQRPINDSRVWLYVAAIIVFLAAAAIYAIVAPQQELTSDRAELSKELSKLQKQFAAIQATQPEEKQKEFLRDAVQQLNQMELRTAGAKSVRDRAVFVISQRLEPNPPMSLLTVATDDIKDPELRKEVAKTRKDINDILKRIYTSEKLGKQEAAKLKEDLLVKTGGQWPMTMAADDIDRLSGTERTADIKAQVARLIAILILGGGLAAWLAFYIYRSSGRKPRGLPLEDAEPEVGNALGWRFFLFLLLYLISPFIIAAIVTPLAITDAWSQALGLALLLAMGLWMFRATFAGYKFSLKAAGWRSDGLAADIFWGIGGWLANWPIAAALLFAGQFIFQWVPSGEHPIQQELLDPSAAVPALLSAAILAPVIEEMFFRGCFFQGLALRMRREDGRPSFFWPAVISSFAFAAIHPQGGALWLSLAWIGFMGCLLTRERRSIIPAIVMHALHNGTQVALLLYLNS